MELAADDDPRLRGARRAVLATAAAGWASCLAVPLVALLTEARPGRQWLGAAGLLILTVAFAAALHAVATPPEPSTSEPSQSGPPTSQSSQSGPPVSGVRRGRLGAAFIGASLLSIGLLAPVGSAQWYTWAWIGGAIAGFAPLLIEGTRRWVVSGAAVAAAVAAGTVTGGRPLVHGLIAASVGAMVIGTVLLPFWLWRLLRQARAGREAQARLAVTQERLRFARDVHDLLGHRLSVIALKAELAARLSGVDPRRSAQEAAQVQQLSVAALAEVREAVHGYRAIDLGDSLRAVEGVLRDAGIRCTVRRPETEPPAEAATQLALTLREGCTNVLRHSTAEWCTIEVSRIDGDLRLTMTNDGARAGPPDRLSFGLQGATERLSAVGGTLHTRREGGVFMLEVTVPA